MKRTVRQWENILYALEQNPEPETLNSVLLQQLIIDRTFNRRYSSEVGIALTEHAAKAVEQAEQWLIDNPEK